MIEEYVTWLLEAYAKKTGTDPRGSDTAAKAIRILRRHKARWPGGEDFVSLVAAEMAERLVDLEPSDGPQPLPLSEALVESAAPGPDERFLRILNQTADAVRHRIVREARRWEAHPPANLIEQVAAKGEAPEATLQVFATELRERLSPEEQAVLTLCLEGASVDQVAEALGVSERTVYRKLQEIERRAIGGGEP